MLIDETRIKVKDLRSNRDFPFAPLEAMGPNLSGWGVVETTLILPNSACLMVGPLACLRHSAFMAHARNFHKHFYMLTIDEMDIAMAKHLPRVEKALLEIGKKEKPEILILAGTCCDYITETDYSEVIKHVRKKLGIDVIYTVMAPLSIGLKPSPFELAYQSLYDILKDKKENTDKESINILGTFLPLHGELHTALRNAGYKRIYQIPTVKNVKELYKMISASLNVVVHPIGSILAKKMEEGLGIPYVFCPVSYDISEIKKQYEKMENAMGRKLDIKKPNGLSVNMLKGKRAAVGCSIYGDPLELSIALARLGAKVDAIFMRNAPKPYEWKYIEKLYDISPETLIYNVSHPYLNENLDVFNEIELAFGVDAGIFCKNAINVPLSRYQKPYYGYENLENLLKSTKANMEKPISNYDWIYKHNFLI